jgi:uncharacterized protein (TIGR02300 family)
VAKPELGMKRQCLNCGVKFFDLNKNPIVCPKCATVFQAPALARAPARPAAGEETEDAAAAPVELVSLEDAEAGDEKVAAAAVDDVEIEDDGVADETFLEEEEEDADDVSGLIDGDIEEDEEG